MKSGLVRATGLRRARIQQDAHGANYLQALDNISFDIAPGSAVGMIGRNGSGKSTLLKLISGIYLPDSGSVERSGKISALIELGAGFHPDFSGRENVYLGGVVYGLTRKEIDERFDEIVAYAELEDFIDDPVRTYSSGMYMRLGFSLAVHTDPDILLIDEVLAVGDAGFIHRCHDTISDFKRRGKTLVFVTHDLPSVVRWCDDVIWLERGVIRKRGKPRQVIDAYMQGVKAEEQEMLRGENQALADSGVTALPEELPSNLAEHSDPNRWGSGDVEITSVQMLDADGNAKWLFDALEPVAVEVKYQVNKPISELVFGIGIVRADGLHVHGTNTDIDTLHAPLPEQVEGEQIAGAYPLLGSFIYRIPRLSLVTDSYYFDVAAHQNDGTPYDYHHRLHKFSVRDELGTAGVYSPQRSWEFTPSYPVQPEEEVDEQQLESELRKAAGA